MSLDEVHHYLAEVLVELDRFCAERGIRYYLYAGTLLGAVRHGGFIPWDDDADVLMPREDFERFCATYESTDDFQLFDRSRNPTFPYASAKLARRGTLVVEEVDVAARDQFGVSVDVFPYDTVDDGLAQFRLHLLVNRIGRALLLLKVVQPAPHRSWWVRTLLTVSRRLLRPVSTGTLTGLRTRIAMSRSSSARNSVSMLVSEAKPWRVQRDVIEPASLVRFGNREFPAPADPHVFLTSQYGDYLSPPPPGKRVPPHRSVAYRLG